MKIEITKKTVANKRFVNAGEVIEVTDAEARLLVGIGKAKYVSGNEQAVEIVQNEKQEPLNTETAEAVVETKLKKPRKSK